MKKIAIVGAGGFGRELKVLIDQVNLVEETYDLIGFYDDGKVKNEIINGLPILGGIKDINEVCFDLNIVMGIADPNTKEKVKQLIDNENIVYPNLIHPSVYIIGDNINLGEGNIICSGVLITCDITIKDFVTINLYCTVGHDTIINDFCSFMPSVNISGEVNISQNVYVGTGAKIINLLNIGAHTIVGAGAVVSKDLPANCTAVGVPAKPIKFHK